MNGILSRFFRSPLGVALAGSCVLLATALVSSGALPLAVGALAAAAVLGLLTLVLLLTPLGAKSVVAERDRASEEKNAKALEEVAAVRKRLALLSVADPGIRSALDRLALAAGTYLEETAKGAPRDPAIEGAVDVAADIVDDWLRTADAASSAARHAGAAPDPREAKAAARALAQTAEEIEGLLGIAAAARDRSAAREELR